MREKKGVQNRAEKNFKTGEFFACKNRKSESIMRRILPRKAAIACNYFTSFHQEG